MKTSLIVINPLTPIKIRPCEGEVATLSFGNVLIELEETLIHSLVLLLQDKQQFNRTSDLFSSALLEIEREMHLKQTAIMDEDHRDSGNKNLKSANNLLNKNSFISGNYLIFDKQSKVELQQSNVLDEVKQERERQDKKWGGKTHDDQHTTSEFVQLIEDYAGWARVMAGMDSSDKSRRRLIQVAALAVAAVESIDRTENIDVPFGIK